MAALTQCVRSPLSPCSCATAVLWCAGSLARTCSVYEYCCAQPVTAWDCSNGIFLSFRFLRFVGFEHVSAGFSGISFEGNSAQAHASGDRPGSRGKLRPGRRRGSHLQDNKRLHGQKPRTEITHSWVPSTGTFSLKLLHRALLRPFGTLRSRSPPEATSGSCPSVLPPSAEPRGRGTPAAGIVWGKAAKPPRSRHFTEDTLPTLPVEGVRKGPSPSAARAGVSDRRGGAAKWRPPPWPREGFVQRRATAW